MFSEPSEIYCQQQRFLPSFRDAFNPYTLSMNSSIEHFLEPPKRKDLGIGLAKSFHPKKSALKRHLEQEKVLVQPVQNDTHLAKRFRSDWDLLFYSNNDSFNADVLGGSINPLPTECKKKRQSFLVRGKEMKSFFHLLGDFIFVIIINTM